MAKTGWWTKSRGVPTGVYRSWLADVSARSSRPPRILAWGATADGIAVASPSTLSYGSESGWAHVDWHAIERGGWDEEPGVLSWSVYGGATVSLELTEPGRLPEVFRERVAASIVLEKFVPLRGSRGVLISGRRALGDDTAAISWNTTLSPGLTWHSEGVQSAAEQAVAQVRTEYDMG